MKVSIIVPVYNVAPYIGNCLSSVMRQSYQGRMECLLIDDCGTDDSIAIAQKMMAEYSGPIRFEILHHDHNRGLSAARNTGVDAAAGEYIYFLDSDDEISVDCIERLMAEVKAHSDVEMVQGNLLTTPIKTVDSQTLKVRQPVAMTNDEVRRCFFKYEQMNVAAWNKLIKRSFLMEHGIRFWDGVIFEDAPWTFLLLKYLERVCFVKEVTYHYMLRKDSIMTGSSSKKKAEDILCNYKRILNDLTVGHEQEELAYFGKKMAYFCARFTKVVPAYKEDITKWQERAQEYGNNGIRMRLSLGKMLSSTQYGWLLLSLWYRIEHPRVIRSDVQRIWLGIRE